MGLATDDDRLTRRVGAVMILMLVVGGFLVVGLEGVHLRAGVEFEVFFEHLGALKEGADVQVAGKVIGEVESIRLVPAHYAEDEDHPLHGTGGIAANVRIEKRYAYMVPINGEYFISAKGIFGERFLEIGAPRDPETRDAIAAERSVVDGDRIRGIAPPRLDRILRRSYDNLVTTKLFIMTVRPEWRKLRRAIDELLDNIASIEPAPGAYSELRESISAVIDDVDRVRSKWEKGDVDIDDFRRLAARTRKTMAHAERNLDEIQTRIDRLMANVDEIRQAVPTGIRERFELAMTKTRSSISKMRRIVTTTRELAAMVERGEGNIGGLTNDPEFSDTAKAIGKILKRQPWRVVGHPQDD